MEADSAAAAAEAPESESEKLAQDPLENMETYNSQEFVVYLNEIQHIRLDSDNAVEDDNPPEEGEEEWEWLRQTGFDSLVSVPEQSSETAEEWDALNTLSQRQAAVVKRRVATLRDTLKKGRGKEKSRRPDMRHLFPSEPGGGGGDGRSRSATPDSLDSLSPPLTPPDACSRLEAGSPHSQGYHSSSRGSLDQLEPAADGEDRSTEYRHVLRIPLVKETPGWTGPEPEAPIRKKTHDATDRVHKALGIFESTGNYKVTRHSAPAESSGIEAVSFNPIGSVKRQSERRGSGLSELGELHIPRVRSGSRADGRSGSTDKTRPATGGRLGRTLVDDLSEPDVRRLQKLALIELTALFDEHGLTYSRRKARRRRLRARPSVTDGAVFGTSLTSLLERDRQRRPDGGGGVPLLLERVLTHLERRGLREEGLLRVPGHRHKVDLLRSQVDDCFYSQPGAVDAALRRSGAHDVAALVKLFLRQLPTPLLTHERMDAFHRCDALPAERRPQALALLCLQLPAPNRAVLRRLLQFLAAVAAQEQSNKMSLENVAMIMAPNLMWPAQRRQKDISVEIEFAAVTSRVIRCMIRHRDQLWEVPPDFIRQLRTQYEAEQLDKVRKESSRPMKKLLRKKDAQIVRKIDNEVDFQNGIMRVTAPQFSKTSWAVSLTEETTAGDVVIECLQKLLLLPDLTSRIQGRRSSLGPQSEEPTPDDSTICLGTASDITAALQGHFLFEVGGNIGQRRIEHDAAMLDCYQENPNARWEIRCCHDTERSSSVEIVAE